MALKNPYKQGGMFEGASHLLFENAKQLRKNMTEAEKILWLYLRTGVNGYKFRRQHPMGLYIADFYCHKAKLVIEIDGSVHNHEDVKTADEIREKELQDWGYTVIRFTNQEIVGQIENVLKKISDIINLINQNKTPDIGV